MKISVISDLHFGYAWNTERGEDSFDAAKEMMKKSSDSDIILLVGDIFDSRNPSVEILTKAMRVLLRPMLSKKGVNLIKTINKDIKSISPTALMGTPVVAIHGTHERRVKGLLNPVEALERAGFLIHIDQGGVVFSIGEEKICIQGMSGVPEQQSAKVLKEKKFIPLSNCFNIFMIHQSIKQFVFDPNGMDINDLPIGFDLYLCGHVHEAKKSKVHNKPFLIPGSPIITQFKRESVGNKGFWKVRTEHGEIKKIDWVPLNDVRKAYYLEFKTAPDEIIEKRIKDILKNSFNKKPMIKIDAPLKNADKNNLSLKFGDKAFIFFKKEIAERFPTRTVEEQRLSVQELGEKILKDNLERIGLDPLIFGNIFELLEEGKYDDVLNFIKQKETIENRKDNLSLSNWLSE